jgi:hypothetical protein
MTTLSPSQERQLAHAKGLLAQTRTVVKHQRELERITGEHFNLFNILRIGHYEVSTHSPILGDLLDPGGTHGQGSIFLELFIQQVLTQSDLIDRPGLERFNPSTARVVLEQSLGERTEIDGGRLDILLTDGSGNQIAIENKIYATEQGNWVRRYRAGLPAGSPLIFLTLQGVTALDGGSKDDEALIPLSYRHDITAWLESCRKEVATVPIVRESLTQYLFLIRKLTHQNTGRRMNDEIVSTVLHSPESLEAFIALRDADTAVRGTIVRGLAERIRPRIPADFPMVATPEGRCAKEEAFIFSIPELAIHNIQAAVCFASANYNGCFFGFEMTNHMQVGNISNPVLDALRVEFRKHFQKAQTTSTWPIWTWWDARRNWDESVLKAIQFEPIAFDDEFMAVIAILRDTALKVTAEICSESDSRLSTPSL